VKESQPWHHLSDPLGLLRSIEIPESLNLGFKADESGNSIGGEITFDEIELKDF
jgi:hypothetical protein